MVLLSLVLLSRWGVDWNCRFIQCHIIFIHSRLNLLGPIPTWCLQTIITIVGQQSLYNGVPSLLWMFEWQRMRPMDWSTLAMSTVSMEIVPALELVLFIYGIFFIVLLDFNSYYLRYRFLKFVALLKQQLCSCCSLYTDQKHFPSPKSIGRWEIYFLCFDKVLFWLLKWPFLRISIPVWHRWGKKKKKGERKLYGFGVALQQQWLSQWRNSEKHAGDGNHQVGMRSVRSSR